MTSPRASPDTISASRSPRSRSSRSCSATRSAAFRHSAAEVRRIVKDLAAKDQAKTPAQGGPVGESVEGPADFAIHDAGDVWRFDPPEFIVDDLLPQHGVVWIGGLPKRFKSLLLLYLCLAIACDRKQVAEHFPIRRWPKILYLSPDSRPS